MQGPDTVELVGLGGKSTWEVLDSVENCSDGELMEDLSDLAPKPQEETKSKSTSSAKSAKSKKKAADAKRRDSDSEEEDTVQLTDPDLAGDAEINQCQPPSESGSEGKEKRTKTDDVKVASKSKRGKKKGKGGGGGAALAGEPATVRSKRKGQNKL